jgi:hypothetical protein
MNSHRDNDEKLSSRFAKFTNATLDAASEIYKAGETGVKEIFMVKKVVKRRDPQPQRVMKRAVDDLRPMSVEQIGGTLEKFAAIEKKIEMERILNSKKISDLENEIALEKRSSAELISDLENRLETAYLNSLGRIDDLEKNVLDCVSEDIETLVAEALAAASKADWDVTERVLLHRIGDLESRVERESRIVVEKLTELENRMAVCSQSSTPVDLIQPEIAELEYNIATGRESAARKSAELEARLESENRELKEMLTSLEQRIAGQEAASRVPDPVPAGVATLESKIEIEKTATVQKLSELESRLERESRSILEKLIKLETRITAEISAAEAVREAACAVQEYNDVAAPEAVEELYAAPIATVAQDRQQQVAEREAIIAEVMTKSLKGASVLGSRAFSLDLAPSGPTLSNKKQDSGAKKTAGGKLV